MSIVSVYQSTRPRNINAFQAAALLYGDWGTSKVYVIGLAFAIASYSSFWLILGVSLLNILVGLNYILICKFYPNGGGVYASVRERSKVLALLGAIFLICDYIITASLSALSAFNYLEVARPELWSIAIIGVIAFINYWGPRHTGNLAFFIAAAAIVIVSLLAILAIPHLKEAMFNTQPLQGSFKTQWLGFIDVIVALSGIEAIANMTGIMKLNPGATWEKPSVTKTSTPAIIAVMLEVSLFTALFSLAINAIPYLHMEDGQVFTQNGENIRDYMLKYLGEFFCYPFLPAPFCSLLGVAVSIVFGALLLSAVNTAIVALNSLLFVMAKDAQFPAFFAKINQYGVPTYALLVSCLTPIAVLLFVHDMETMAHLYAIGFVGAIATNLGSTSTNKNIPLRKHERFFMFCTFLLIAFIEITLFYEKPHARVFVITVIALGLILRALVLEQLEKKKKLPEKKFSDLPAKVLLTPEVKNFEHVQIKPHYLSKQVDHIHEGAILCAVTHIGKTLEFAIQESKNSGNKLFLLFIREQMINAQGPFQHWIEDNDAANIFDYTLNILGSSQFEFIYDVSNLPHANILEHAKQLKVSKVIMGMPRTNRFLQIIRGDVVSEVFRKLPMNIDLVVIS